MYNREYSPCRWDYVTHTRAEVSHTVRIQVMSRKPLIQEDKDIRRARLEGELACAECRRLKLKCNKQVPCSSCIRRSCSDICPNGTGNPTRTQASRGAWSVNDRLRKEMQNLRQRVKELEHALADLQATISQEPHPLLFGKTHHAADHSDTRIKEEEILEALGSLSISDNGQAFFGPTGGSEALFLHVADLGSSIPDRLSPPDAPPEVTQLSELFPFFPGGAWHKDSTLHAVLDVLPDRQRAWSLCETYFQQANLVHRIVEREEVIDELIVPLYKHLDTVKAGGSSSVPLSYHQIGVLFSMFAMAALMDLTLPESNAEAEGYAQLAHACIELRDIFEVDEIATVQVLALITSYFMTAGHHQYNVEVAWRPLSLACLVGHNIGLHRDPARWGFDIKVVQRRRNLFWELCGLGCYLSLATGRPPNISRVFSDCQYPDYKYLEYKEESSTSLSLLEWKHRFTDEVYFDVNELSLQTRPATYEEILALDKKIREHPMPQRLDMKAIGYDSNLRPLRFLEEAFAIQSRGVVTIFLHRKFFAQAILEHPDDPLQSKYATSFTSALKAATDLIGIMMQCYEQNPPLCRRWWPFFIHLFSAGMIVGSVVIRNPSRSTAEKEIMQLRAATELYSKVSSKTRGGRYGQIILARLLAKATKVYQSHFSGGDRSSESRRDLSDDTELAIFGGHGIIHKDEAGSSKKIQEGLHIPQGVPGSSNHSNNPFDVQAQTSTIQTHPVAFPPHPSFEDSFSSVPSDINWDILGIPGGSEFDLATISFANDLYTNFPDAEIELTREGDLLSDGWMSFIQDTGILDNFSST